MAPIGVHDIVDVDDLTTDLPAAVQVHGDRVILNLSPDSAETLGRVIARHEATNVAPVIASTWTPVLVRLITAAAVIRDPLPAETAGTKYLPILGRAT